MINTNEITPIKCESYMINVKKTIDFLKQMKKQNKNFNFNAKKSVYSDSFLEVNWYNVCFNKISIELLLKNTFVDWKNWGIKNIQKLFSFSPENLQINLYIGDINWVSQLDSWFSGITYNFVTRYNDFNKIKISKDNINSHSFLDNKLSEFNIYLHPLIFEEESIYNLFIETFKSWINNFDTIIQKDKSMNNEINKFLSNLYFCLEKLS